MGSWRPVFSPLPSPVVHSLSNEYVPGQALQDLISLPRVLGVTVVAGLRRVDHKACHELPGEVGAEADRVELPQLRQYFGVKTCEGRKGKNKGGTGSG